MSFIPHTIEDIEIMLTKIGSSNIESLFDEIPKELLSSSFRDIPESLSELELNKLANVLANKNQIQTLFAGAGSYDHHIPAAIWDIAQRGEFLTSYTPYQAEASQGNLQLIYEFQSMICELTAMEVSNASLYDGASALAEAIFMAVRINAKSNSKRILMPASINPFYLDTVRTIVRTQGIEIITLEFDAKSGITDVENLKNFENEDIAALVLTQPNFFGCLEKVDELVTWAKQNNIITIAMINPISLGLLKPPGIWGESGVDITCGEGQSLGIPLASGGPYFGFFATRKEYVRQMPGRVVGKTLDKDGKTGFILTLQAREQHIRRSKATSNICTNQGLLVTAATLYMSLMGSEGIKNVAKLSHHNTCKLVDELLKIEGVELCFESGFFHEVLLHFKKPLPKVLAKLSDAGIFGGLEVEKLFPKLPNCLLTCVTEKRTDEEIAHFVEIVKTV